MAKRVDATQQPGGREKRTAAAQVGEMRPDLRKRGAVRWVFDGCYRLTRYYSPKQHDRLDTMEALSRFNDLEVFDLERDLLERENLALDPKRNGAVTSGRDAAGGGSMRGG
jgi:arylsulfatase